MLRISCQKFHDLHRSFVDLFSIFCVSGKNLSLVYIIDQLSVIELYLAQELCKKFPNKKVMFGVVASDYPRLKITPEYAVAMGKALASMYVEDKGREELAFTLALVIYSLLLLSLRFLSSDFSAQGVQADMNLSFIRSNTTYQYLISGNVSNPKYVCPFVQHQHQFPFSPFQIYIEPQQNKHWTF